MLTFVHDIQLNDLMNPNYLSAFLELQMNWLEKKNISERV